MKTITQLGKNNFNLLAVSTSEPLNFDGYSRF